MVPVWVFVGVATAVVLAGKTLLMKHLTRDRSSLELGFLSTLLATLLLVPVGILAWTGTTAFTAPLVASILFVGVANTVGVYAYFRALEAADVSVVSPLRQTIPVFVALLEPLALATPYRLPVLLGAGLTSIGAYVTLIEPARPFRPLRSLRAIGPRYAFLSAFTLAAGSIGVKFAVDQMPIGVFVVLVFAVQTVGFAVMLRARGQRIAVGGLRQPSIAALGGLTALVQVLIFATIRLSTASEATILFRLSILLNVLIGSYLFQEEHLRYRLLGGLLVFAGVLAVI